MAATTTTPPTKTTTTTAAAGSYDEKTRKLMLHMNVLGERASERIESNCP